MLNSKALASCFVFSKYVNYGGEIDALQQLSIKRTAKGANLFYPIKFLK